MKPRRRNLMFLLSMPFFIAAAINGFQPAQIMPGILMLLVAIISTDIERRKEGGARSIPWVAVGICLLTITMTAFVWLTVDVHWAKQSFSITKWTLLVGTLFCVAYTSWYGVTGKG